MTDSEKELDEPMTKGEMLRNIVSVFVESVILAILFLVWAAHDTRAPMPVVSVLAIAIAGVFMAGMQVYIYTHPDDEEEEIDDDEEEYPVSCPCAMCRPVNPYVD